MEIGRIGRFFYKLRGATKSFANATLKGFATTCPDFLKLGVLDSPFGAEGLVFNTEARRHREEVGGLVGGLPDPSLRGLLPPFGVGGEIISRRGAEGAERF